MTWGGVAQVPELNSSKESNLNGVANAADVSYYFVM